MLQLTIIGHIGQDAIIQDAGGKKVINFTVAHSEKYTNAQGVKENRTTWVKCAIWRDSNQTSIANYLKKGTQIMAQGIPSIEVYTNRDNKQVGVIRLRVNSVELLGSGQNQSANNQQPQPQQDFESNNNFNNGAEDDLPF